MKSEMVVSPWEGKHNSSNYQERLMKEGLYKDRSTICIIPTRGVIHAKVVQNWMGLMSPMNQKFTRIFMIGLEVGEAYEQAISSIISHPELSNWKYIFTLEEDNMVPPDCLLKLYQAIDEGYDAVGGLYWTKGEGGMPMCYGDPCEFPVNFVPKIPKVEGITPCRGLGMGATLFKMDIFKEGKIEKPFFKTVQQFDYGVGGQAFTQDLYFFNKACKHGYKFACDSRVKVGHYDAGADIIW